MNASAKTPAKTPAATPARRTRRTPAKVQNEQGLSLIIADEKSKALVADKLVDQLVSIGFSEVSIQRADDTLVSEMERYRRMFPAAGDVQSRLGTDQPDLIGQTAAYKDAWTVVVSKARAALSERMQSEWGFPSQAADNLAATKVERDRKSVSVIFRNRLEKQVRDTISNPVERAIFMLGHGFKYSTVVTGDAPCIPVKDSKVERDDKTGALTLTVPGHVVNAKAGTIKEIPAKTTAANQTGKGTEGDTPETSAKALVEMYTTHLKAHDVIALLGDAQALLTSILSTTVPESTDLAELSRAFVSLERSALLVKRHAGITDESYRAARAHKPAAAATKRTVKSEEEKAEEYARSQEMKEVRAAAK